MVVILQENHSFNDLLGKLCVDESNRCAGSTTGVISDGTRIDLRPEHDNPPSVGHTIADQVAAIDGGRMDGWDHVSGCAAKQKYACLSQAQAGAVPTLWSLADRYAMSDMTFQAQATASWGSHLDLVAATLDGFVGDQPVHALPGTGCNSSGDALWRANPGDPPQYVPSCVPDRNGQGPYRSSPVPYVPTIMDSLDAAGLDWHIYAPGQKNAGYGWAICPSFYECLGSDQATKVRHPHDFARDAASGRLPSLSIVIPYYNDSQHPPYSLLRGDNWIAQNVSAVMDGPDWKSTAIFITYDDCGCFYDPVPPPTGGGVREPLLIVSPWVRAGFVDHTLASHISMLAFTEHVFGLPPLSGEDGSAYDYGGVFNFAQQPLPGIRLLLHPVPPGSLAYIRAHPPDPDDPT